VDPKLAPSELLRTQGAVPRAIFLRSYIHVEQTESQEKKENNKRLIADPPPRLTSFVVSGVSGTLPLTLTARWPWYALVRHMNPSEDFQSWGACFDAPDGR
jgi:hypothetical protein